MKQNGFVVKITASTLLLTFSYSQILMAADVRQMLLDAKAFFAEEDAQRPHGMAASDLQAAQTQQQAAVDQQQLLQDFQNTNFSLTTANGDVLKYVGDKLSEVERPDGTQLGHIVTDAQGNIQNADLKLSDGSFQVFQNGQVVGYQTPDGNQVFYANGVVTKVIDKAGMETFYTYTKNAQGAVTETALDNPKYLTKYDANGKIKEATRKSDNQKIYYAGGVIQRIVNADASQTLFNSAIVNGDTVVTPQGGASDIYIDAQGNKFNFVSGSVSKITLTDNSTVDNITWDAANKIDSATLTEADGSKYIYQLKKLTRSYDPAGVVTNFTYTAASVLAAKAGNTWEYLSDGTAVKYTNLTGDVTTYLQSGVYKGLRDKDVLATGQTFVYEYSGSGASIIVQKREVQTTVLNVATFDGWSYVAQASNPYVKTTVAFPNDGTISQAVVITAANSANTKKITLNMVSGTGSTYVWAGVTTSLGVTLNKGTSYKVEVVWETSRVGIYVYAAAAAKPTTPTVVITDRAWDPKFVLSATNTSLTVDSSNSGYNKNATVWEKNYPALPNNPSMRFDFKMVNTNYKTMQFLLKNVVSGVTRTYNFYYSSAGVWTFSRTDGTTAVASSTLTQTYTPGTDYVAEVRLENGKMNFYVYAKGQARPAALASFDSLNTATMEIYTVNATGLATEYKNLTTPTVQSVTASPLTSRVGTIQNSSIVKPAAPASVNATDFNSITYDSTAALKQVLFKDGSKLVFNQGFLTQAFDAAGKLTTFNLEQSGLSNIIGASIVQNNLTSNYGADGKLSSVKTGDLTVHYKSDQTVEYIEKTDGTELWNLVFSAQGALTDALIIAPDGEERTYVAGKLTSLHRPDLTDLFYANNKVTQMLTPEKILYNFDYTNPAIIQAVLVGAPPVDALTPIKMEYDTNFNLKKVTRQNQEILNYLNTDLVQIDAPQSVSKVFNYTKDAQGKVLSYTVTQGNVLTYYDANNQPIRAVISPDVSNPNTLDISYQYGKIRQVKKNNVLTFTYSYSFEASGVELTVVEDLEENTQKTYQDSNLASTLDKATNVLSSYEYTSSKVSKVTVTRFGRLLHTYAYSYNGTNTVVQDEAGIVRTYDLNKKLTLLDKNGEKFAYTYSTQTVTTQNGPPVTTETLLPNTLYQTSARSTLSGGAQAWFSYEQQWGKDYLQTHSAGQWVEYTVNLSQAGDLKIALEATDSNLLPSGYANFLLDFTVDGAAKGTMSVPAVGSNAWQAGALTLTGLSQGSHVIRLKFANFVSSGGQITDFKFRNISFKQVVTSPSTTTTQQEIVGEDLIEKKLSDGTLVHYSGDKVSQIDQVDGKILKNIVRDENGEISETTLYSSISDPAGKKFYFTDGRISKTSSGELITYEMDPTGNVIGTSVKDGSYIYKYDAQENLLGIKLDGVKSPAEIIASTTNNYIGGTGGAFSFDNNFGTAQFASFGGGAGSSSSDLYSEHFLPVKSVVTGLTYKISAFGSSNGNSDNGSSAYGSIETRDATTGVWMVVPGTSLSQIHNNSGGGGSTAQAISGAEPVVLTVNISNVDAIRARSGVAAYANGRGSINGSASIYDIQFSLADQSYFDFKAIAGADGQVTGYTLSNYKGTLFSFNLQGMITQTSNPPSNLLLLGNMVLNFPGYITVPYKNSSFDLMHALTVDSETVVAQEFSSNGSLETQTKADGTTTLFENNKPSKVLGSNGRVLIQYTYDTNGNPTRVYLKNARDTLPDEVLKAKEDIQAQRALALRTLASQKNLAYQSIQNQFSNAQQALQSQIGTVQANYDNVASSEAKGKTAKSAKADALGQISSNIDALRGQSIDLYDQEADAYANLDAQVMTLSNQIEANSQTAFTQLSTQEANLKKEILRQEVSPIVYDYYRRILGRDPDSTEYSYWINLIDYNSGTTLTEVKTTAGVNLTAALLTSINALPELSQRQTYVSAIKTAVTSQINSYLSMTPAQKEAFAATLGLTAQDLVPISSADTTKILNWINTRSLHFGQSAFIALETLLDQKAKVYTRETLARQCILIDVLTGVISPLDDGDLVISVFALNKVAGLYGVTLTGANLSWDDLKAIVPTTSTATSPRVIAHINGNHYVVITGITQDSITYIDPGIGKDKQNESITVTKAGFLKVWQGNVTLNQTDFNSIKTIRGAATQAKVLSAMEAKNIRGAFWGSILNILSWVVLFTPLAFLSPYLRIAAIAVSAIEGDWITAITATLAIQLPGGGTIGSSIQTAFADAFNGVTSAMGSVGDAFNTIGRGIYSVYQSVVGFIDSTVNFLPGIGPALQGAAGTALHTTIGAQIVNTALSTGLRIGVSKGLESLGVSPQISGFAANLAAGAVIGALGPLDKTLKGVELSRAQTIQNSIQTSTTIAQVGNLGIQMGLDPIFTRILGNSLAAIQGIAIQNPSTALDQSFSLVKNQLTTSLAQYSLEKLGNSVGLNYILSAALAAPISTAFAQGISNVQWQGQAPSNASLAVSINKEGMVYESTGTPVSMPASGTTARTWWDSTMNFLQNNLPNMINSGVEAYYASLARPIIPGLTPPPPTTAETPIPANGAAVNYTDFFTGSAKAGYQINSSQTSYIVYDKITGMPVKRVSNGVIEEGKFEYIAVLKPDNSISIDYRNPNYLSGGQVQYTTPQNGRVRFIVVDKKVYEIYADAASPDIVLNPGTTKNASNKVINGIVKILTLGLELSVANGVVSKSTGGNLGSEELTKKIKRVFVFGNGFENARRLEDTPDPLIESYVLDLEGRTITSPKIINPTKKLMFYLYEMTDMVFNGVDWLTDFKPELANGLFHALEGPLGAIFDTTSFLLSVLSDPSIPVLVRNDIQKIKNYLAQDWGIGNNLVQEVMSELDKKGPIEDGIAFVHSGATAPLLEALRLKPYDIQTVIVYEGPHPDYNENLLNPNLERVIHVRGTGDVFEGDALVPFLGWANFDNTANSKFENTNIQILGAFHNDFTYIGSEWAANPPLNDAERTRERINRRTNLFMRDLYQAALRDQTEPNALADFFTSLERTGAAEKVSGIWQIDPDFLRD